MTTFNGVLQSHTRDHGRERWYQEQDRKRQEDARVARAAHWFGLRVVGKQWASIDQLRLACVALAETLYGGQMDDETAGVVSKAITALWMGRVEWALFREPRVTATITESGVSFALAS